MLFTSAALKILKIYFQYFMRVIRCPAQEQIMSFLEQMSLVDTSLFASHSANGLRVIVPSFD